jgi:high-affinity Fe2+/Pb2+ permease
MATNPRAPHAFEERRAPERRSYERRAEDRTLLVRTAASAALAICGGLTLVYLFFAALGAVDFGEAAVASTVAVVLALVWFAGYWWRHRAERASVPNREDRERRGF